MPSTAWLGLHGCGGMTSQQAPLDDLMTIMSKGEGGVQGLVGAKVPARKCGQAIKTQRKCQKVEGRPTDHASTMYHVLHGNMVTLMPTSSQQAELLQYSVSPDHKGTNGTVSTSR